jgi:lysyl-tRNA synthetase class 2
VVTASGVRAPDESRPRERPQWRPRVPGLVAFVVRLAAVFAVLDILHPISRPHYGSRALNGVVSGSIFAAAVFAAGAMLVLAGALKRRKRRAWVLAVAVVALGAATHVPGHRWAVVAVNVAVLVLLVAARRDFTAISERTGRRVALRVFLVMGTVSVVAGLFLTARTAPASSLSDRFEQVFIGLLGFTPDLAFRDPDAASAITETALTTLGGLTALLTLVALLAPARKPSRLAPQTEQTLRGLLDRFGGRDSLGYFALRGDKTAILSPSGKAAVAYRVIGGVTLAAGDPLGDPEAWPGAIQAWLEEADRYAWVPGVIGASEDGAIAYKRAGLDSLELGDEAVLHLDEFSLEGRSMRAVRQAVNRVRRAGYTLDVRRQRDLSPQELEEASAAAERFRGEDVERGFSMALGRLGDPRDPELVVARARDEQGRIVAVLTFVPWGAEGLSLDLMRRAREAVNGTVEFVVTGVAEQACGLGVRRISLNFAVFRSVFERGSRVGAGPVLRLWHRLLLVASRWWQIESLYRANAKYSPEWVPRFVCFRRAGELYRVGMAALEAEAFVQFPRLRWLAR